jgi:uncharacterized repeat protein (TIGR04076 family)
MPEESKAPRIILEIVSQKGECAYGHKAGQVFDVTGTTPEGLCPSACHSAYPAIYTLKFGGHFPWEEEKGTAHVACPDPANPLIMKIRREG